MGGETSTISYGGQDQALGRGTLISVGLFFESFGSIDQLSPRKELEGERLDLGSTQDIGMAAVGEAVEIVSCFGFFGFCSC